MCCHDEDTVKQWTKIYVRVRIGFFNTKSKNPSFTAWSLLISFSNGIRAFLEHMIMGDETLSHYVRGKVDSMGAFAITD